MNRFTRMTSRVAPLLRDDIDTDQIIPARFLKVIDKKGLGDQLFQDWRYHEDGGERADFVLNQAQYKGAQVLLAGANFGCGSSREHAPWALTDYGFRAVVATSFADIFCNNSLKNGLLPIAVSGAGHQQLQAMLRLDPAAEVVIDLPAQTLQFPDGSKIEFPVDAFAKKCLVEGIDQLGYVRSFAAEVETYEQKLNKV